MERLPSCSPPNELGTTLKRILHQLFASPATRSSSRICLLMIDSADWHGGSRSGRLAHQQAWFALISAGWDAGAWPGAIKEGHSRTPPVMCVGVVMDSDAA